MQHFLIPGPLKKGPYTLHDPELIHQLLKVLRFRVGDECVLLNGQGAKGQSRLSVLNKKEAVFAVENVETYTPPATELHLYCALSKKPATFELILQKAVELGVTSITPLITERTQVQDVRKMTRLNLILKEAVEQSERVFAPQLNPPLKLLELLEGKVAGTLLVGDARDFDAPLKKLLGDSMIHLVIGPEGGLSSGELAALRKVGGKVFHLGDEVLRMETAAIAALSVVRFG